MHAAMGNAHWIGVHFVQQQIKMKCFDEGQSRDDLVINYLKHFIDASQAPDGSGDYEFGYRDHHFAFFDNIHMRRFSNLRVMSFGNLCQNFRRVRDIEGDKGDNLMIFQTEDLTPLGIDHELSHAIGHTLGVQKAPITQRLLESMGGFIASPPSAKRFLDFLSGEITECSTYYYPNPVIKEYEWNYAI